MERAIETFSVYTKKEALCAQIKVRVKLLGVQMEGKKLKVSKASIDEHKEYMSQLMLEEIPEENIALEKFIIIRYLYNNVVVIM